MKLTMNEWLLRTGTRLKLVIGPVLIMGLMGMALGWTANAQAVTTTTVQGTVYLANGTPGAGTLNVSWPSFATASGQLVTAGHLMVTIAPDGFLSVNLTPNVGAMPAGLYYTAVYQMSDGTVSTQYWVVPAAAQASLSQVQAQLMPAAQAVQAVSKAYVDQSVAELTGSLLTASGGNLSGPLYLNGDPTQSLQAADKHYVDSSYGAAVPLAGGSMTGALVTPAVNGVEAPLAGSAQATLQAAVNAAGTTGAVEIPPTYAGTDGFTNPNGVYVTDLRQNGSQQFARSVKEFGAVCDGVTDDTSALQSALNYARTHGVALTIPQGTCKTHTLSWHGESIGGLGKQVSALMGFPGQDVLASAPDSTNLLSYTRIHDLTIYVDQSMDVSCSAAEGRAPAGSCAMSRPMESNSVFSPGGNGLSGTTGTGMAWAVGNCAIAMPALTGAGGNGLRVAEIENLEITPTGVDPMAQYTGAHSTHTCGLYLAQWPQWSEFRNIDICGLNTGIAIPALPGTAPSGLNSDSNRWEDITIAATHGFTAAAGSNNVLDNAVVQAGNSAATGEPPTGLVLDFAGAQQGWIARNAQVSPVWNAVQPQLAVTAAGGAVTGVTAGLEHGLGFDPYGTRVPLAFSGSCTAQATANVNSDGSIGTVSVTQGGVGCSGTTTANVNVTGTWDTAAPVNLIAGQNVSLFGGNLLKGNGGYTVWNAAGSQSYGTQLDGGGGILPGGGSYTALVLNNRLGTSYQVDQFPGVDFGAKLQACLQAVSAVYGGTCDARNFTGTLSMGSNLTISTANATVLLPCATISTANQVIVTAGTRNVALRGCTLRGASTASGTQGGTVLLYSGTGAMVQVGDPTYAADTMGFHLDNAVINTTAASSATAQGLVSYRTQEMDIDSLYFLGNSNQTGMTLDGTGNYTGGSFFGNQFSGFRTAVQAIGHQVANAATTDWMNASTFVRLHIDCPTSGGSPISGTYGINLQQGDGNTFTGGDVEGCATAMHFGPNAQNNTIVGLRNENSTNQVVADAGSSYNNWMTGGTMFTGQLTDNGTRNSFLDTFHRSFNGMTGDWYGSQQDATVTNHYRIGIGTGNERGLLNRYQTDNGYRWTTGLSDATAGEQFYQVLDELNNVYRLSIGQYNNGQSSTNNQTVVNAAGAGAVVLNGSNNSGTGGVVIGSGGASETTVATISNTGSAQFNGTLQVSGASTFVSTPTVKNLLDAEIDASLWAGLTTSQKESLIYKDYNGNSQWYAEKDASNNWELNSAVGGLDSFKAYQSTNSGDTYINASNSSGLVRVNYETGAGTGFNIYGGSSSLLYASFTGANSIKLPGLAAGTGHNCMQIDNTGYLTNTGTACGTGSGTVSSASAGQIAYYNATGAAVTGLSAVPMTSGGTGAASAAAALTNLGGAALAGAAFSGPVSAPSVAASINGMINVMAPGYGAACNDKTYTASIGSGSNAVTGSGFTSSMVGQQAVFYQAGVSQSPVSPQTTGAVWPLVTTVATYTSSTQITLAANSSNAVTNGTLEIGTNDQVAIQNAVNAACAAGQSVLIPAAASGYSCLAGTTNGSGQGIDLSGGGTCANPVSIMGQGETVSFVTGMPGDDVFYWPDGGTNPGQGSSRMHDMTITTDVSEDVSGLGPLGTGGTPFPYRVSGTAGGLTAISPAIAAGPLVFSDGIISLSTPTIFDCAQCQFANNAEPEYMPGQPVTINGAGVAGAALTTTIASVNSNTEVVIATPASTAVSAATGSWGAGRNPPWYVGNCGIAFSASNQVSGHAVGIQGRFYNLNFATVPLQVYSHHHNCAMFYQRPPYYSDFDNINIRGYDYGYNEALPYFNFAGLTWTPDTSSYRHMQIFAMNPFVQYAGNHRVWDGINLYGSAQPFQLGAFTLNGPINTAGDSVVTEFYWECYGGSTYGNSGEGTRWSGAQWNIANASITQCNYPYLNWQASKSAMTSVSIGGPSTPAPSTAGLQLAGSGNDFETMFISGSCGVSTGCDALVNVNDTGGGNRVIDVRSSVVPTAANIPMQPRGYLNGDSGLLGTSAEPYTNAGDLKSICGGMSITFVGAGAATCVNDTSYLTDQNPAGTYLNITSTSGSVVLVPSSLPWTVGGGLPAGKVYVTMWGIATGSGSQSITVVDKTGNISLTTCSYAMTTSWSIHGSSGSADPCILNLTSVTPGHVLDVSILSSATFSPENIAYVQFIPQITDPVPLPSGSTAVTQPTSDTSTEVATDQYVHNAMTGQSGVVSTTAPPWLQNLGSGADGAFTLTSGSASLSGEKYYTSFNVSSGATLTVNGNTGLVVHSQGPCTITGNVNARGVDNTGSANYGGAGAGGSGGGTAAGGSQATFITAAGNGQTAGGHGTNGASAGGNASGLGGTPNTTTQRLLFNSGGGTDGLYLSGATGSAGGSSGGAGGVGGSDVVLMCASINGTGGVVDTSGGPGNPPAANNTGAGAGAGGGVIILSSQGTLTAPSEYFAPGAGAQVSVPEAAGEGGTCTTEPVMTLGVTAGALSSCTVAVAGSCTASGNSAPANWAYAVLGGGGSGGTVTPTWSSGTIASCTASGGSGYTAATYTTAGTSTGGGAGWTASVSGW